MAEQEPKKIHPIELNCFPECSEPRIVNSLKALLPCIDITRFTSSFLLNSDGLDSKVEQDKFDDLIAKAKAIQSNKGKVSNLTLADANVDENVTFMQNLFGFISAMTETADAQCFDIPIINSPQIAINNSSGWTHEQSLLQFIKTQLTGKGLGAILLDATGWKDIVNGAIDEIERFSALAGLSARVSPYFSLLDQPFNDKARISAEIKLINDSESHAIANATFLDYFIKGALISSKEGRRTDGEGTTMKFIGMWQPPCVFNVGLKYGTTNGTPPAKYVKRYFYCTLEATVSPEGLMRKLQNGNRVPDAYSVNLNFTSLLPDTIDTWRGGFLKHLGGK